MLVLNKKENIILFNKMILIMYKLIDKIDIHNLFKR